MNILRKMFLKTGIILIILQTVHSAVEKKTNRTCTGYDSSRANLVNETTRKNEKDLSGIGEGVGSSESSIVLDPHASTTQKYENSKLLFNYIVPANSKPSKNKEREEEEEDQEEEKEEEDEEEVEVEEETAAAEDEEETAAAEEEEETAAAEEEEEKAAAENEEEEEEYRNKDVKEENESPDVEDHEEAAYGQKDHVTEEKEEKREDEGEGDEDEEEYEEEEEEEEKEEEETRSIPDHGYKEENQDEEEEAEEEESGPSKVEERTEKGTTSAPIIPWRHSYPALMREIRPRLDFTTAQPYEDAKPVSYSSVVYDPEGNSKTELSGSFYRKPLKLMPRSKLFRKELENVSEDTKAIHVTTSPVAEERSIQAPLQEENEDDFEAIKRGFEARPMRILNLKVPRHSFGWDLPEKLQEEEESKNYNEKTRQKYHDKSNKEKYYEQVINTRFGEKESDLGEGDDNYESEVQDLMKPQTEWKHETVQKEVVSEEEEMESGENYKPTNKDRNQLYEYVVENVPPGQGTSENKPLPQKYAATTPKRDEISTAVPPENKTAEATTVKPYSFGTITKSNQALTFNNPDNSEILYNQIVSDIQSMFTPSTPKPTNYEQRFLPSRGHCRTSLPDHDSANYETFIQPSRFQHGEDEGEEEEEEGNEEEEEENPMPKRLPMKTYVVRKTPVKIPSGVKVTVYPVKPRPQMMHREARPVSFRNTVYSRPVPSSNTLVRKIFYYEPRQKILHYSPTNQIFRVARPQTTKFRQPPSGRVVIIRKL